MNTENNVKNVKTAVINESQANELVTIALEFIRGFKVLKIERFPRDETKGGNFYDYRATIELPHKNTLRIAIIPFSMDDYYELLRKGLELKGYKIKKTKRRLDGETIEFAITYYIEPELANTHTK